MKKVIYALIFSLVAVSGLVFANHESQIESSAKPIKTTITAPASQTEMNKWEATPDGSSYKKWTLTTTGKKVLADAAYVSKNIRAFSNMEAVVTSVSLPAGSRLGYGIIANIDSREYILTFDLEASGKNYLSLKNEYEDLQRLKVNDKIIIRSHNVSHAPKYFYPIISVESVERNGKMIYKRPARKGGC